MPRAALALLLCAPALRADDWPQWLGPERDAVWRETGLVDTFPEGGPKVLWRAPVGPGYTGPAVAGGRVYLMDRKSAPPPLGKAALGTLPGSERVLCLDAATGKEVWVHEYDCPYSRVSYPQGPRTTPLVRGGKVYTLGTMGDLRCLDAATGKVEWAKHLMRDSGVRPAGAPADPDDPLPKADVTYNVMPPIWGYSAHLLLDGGKLFTLVGGDGGAVRAFDAATGNEVWKALTDREVCYAPPVLTEAGGARQLIVWTASQLASVNPETGAVYWKLPYPNVPPEQKPKRPGQPALTITTPKVAGGMVFVASFFDGAMAAKLDPMKPAATPAWGAAVTKDGADKLPTVMTSLLVKDGHIFGLNAEGEVECRKAETGEEVWKDPLLYAGKKVIFPTVFWVENGDRVVALTDLGDLVLLSLTPAGGKELGRAHILEPTLSTRGRKAVWSHPAFAGKCVFARNDKEIVCVSLAKG